MQNYNLFEIQSREITGDPIVTVEEVKSYLRLEGFQDDESDSTPFEEDDTLIEELIEAATETLELKYSIAIREQTITALITNLAGNIDLLFCPVADVDSFELTDEDGSEITDFKLIGTKYVKLKYPCYCNMIAVYDSGFDEVPKKLKTEILRMVAWLYTNRGESSVETTQNGFSGFQFTTGEYNRNAWLA
jgi:hypothetical protein